MKVYYKGVTGELEKLELSKHPMLENKFYNLSIFDSEKQAVITFEGITLEDVKFLGGAVSFGV